MAPGTVASSACSTRRTVVPSLRMAPLAAPAASRPAGACRPLCTSAAAAASAASPSPSAAPSPPLAAASRPSHRSACCRRRRHARVGRPPLLAAAALTDVAAPPPSPGLADLAAAAAAAPSCRLVKEVAVAVQRTSITSRVLVAAVDIAAPPSAVWGALTDYERLAEFIPSLERNDCLARDPAAGTARLRQVGAQDVALGVKFRAAVTLDIREHVGPGGIPPSLVTSSLDSRDYLGKAARFPAPVTALEDDEDADGEGRAALVEAAQAMEGAGAVPSALSTLMSVDEDDDEGGAAGGAAAAAPAAVRTRRSWPRDISFELVEGDFSAFRGVWRVTEGPAGPLTARLAYSVFVQPQAFLPVGLIQGRISRDVATNLKSVRAHAEEVVFERLLRQQQEKQQQQQHQEADAAVV